MLEGVRVLDFSRTASGLNCSLILNEMGAEVIQVEPTRKEKGSSGSRTAEGYLVNGLDTRFLHLCRNKKSILLNLKDPDSKEVLHDLVRNADVVLDNNRPQALARLGIEYDTLKKINPMIISCSVTGFRRDGHYANVPMFDHVAQALSGFWSLSGEPGKMPLVSSIQIIDVTTGMFAAHKVLAALYEREHTGKGQKVSASMLNVGLFLTNYDGAAFLNGGDVPKPQGTKYRSLPLFGAFQTKDSYIALCAPQDRHFQGVCTVLSLDNLSNDPQYTSRGGRVENREKLNAIVQEEFLKWETATLLKRLEEEDVPVSEILTLDKAFSNPMVIEENAFSTVEWKGKTLKVVDCPVRTPKLKEKPYTAPPEPGEHTNEIMSGLLGYSEDKIKQLREKDVIG